jgi:preprotein translocase subunit SecA
LEDELIRVFGGEKIKSLMNFLKIPENAPIESKMVSKAIDDAQARVEGFNFDMRKHLLDYDLVLNLHREAFYKKRYQILTASPKEINDESLRIVLNYGFSKKEYEEKEREIGNERLAEIEKYLMLRILDALWIDHLENMEHLRDSVALRVYGQRDPLVEYKKEGNRIFRNFFETFESSFAKLIMSLRLEIKPDFQGFSSKKPGRNDPCPCGSGKKYKKCCWPKYG